VEVTPGSTKEQSTAGVAFTNGTSWRWAAAAARSCTRERQVFAYAELGHSDKLIAYSLGLSLSTVSTLLSKRAAKTQDVAGADAELAADGRGTAMVQRDYQKRSARRDGST
jgi:hypothetical protein